MIIVVTGLHSIFIEERFTYIGVLFSLEMELSPLEWSFRYQLYVDNASLVLAKAPLQVKTRLQYR